MTCSRYFLNCPRPCLTRVRGIKAASICNISAGGAFTRGTSDGSTYIGTGLSGASYLLSMK